MNQEAISTLAFRLKPGEDLKRGIQEKVQEYQLEAGWIVTCVGSLTKYQIRFANQEAGSTATGYFEIVSLAGTVSINGSHLHIVLSDHCGNCIGGHLLDGAEIYTTAEIIIQSTSQYIFNRNTDGSTPWKELVVDLKKQAL